MKSVGWYKSEALPTLDLADHETSRRMMWQSGLVRLGLATQHVRAQWTGTEPIDTTVLDDPTLSNDAMLAQMQASMAVGF